MGDLEVTVGVHDQRLKALEARMKEAEQQQKQIQELTLSVRELAGSVKQLVERQQNHDEAAVINGSVFGFCRRYLYNAYYCFKVMK